MALCFFFSLKFFFNTVIPSFSSVPTQRLRNSFYLCVYYLLQGAVSGGRAAFLFNQLILFKTSRRALFLIRYPYCIYMLYAQQWVSQGPRIPASFIFPSYATCTFIHVCGKSIQWAYFNEKRTCYGSSSSCFWESFLYSSALSLIQPYQLFSGTLEVGTRHRNGLW